MTREQLDAFENWICVLLTLHTEGLYVNRGIVEQGLPYDREAVLYGSDAASHQCASGARKELEKALGINQ